jgi:hypothetical protein
MAVLPSSGALSINDIAGVMGGTAPHSLSEYYRGGGLVPSTKTVTTTEGPSYAISGADYYWSWNNLNDYVFIWWADVRVYLGYLGASTVTVTIGDYTYTRGTIRVTLYLKNPEREEYQGEVSRSSSTTVNINGSVPTSGQISISNLYGAEKP